MFGKVLDSLKFPPKLWGAMGNTRQPYIPPKPETLPVFIRIPSPGSRCPYCGLSRSSVDRLVRPQAANGFKPPVRSKLYRQRGNVVKVRLINFQSLMAYLNSLPDGGDLLNLKNKEVATKS